MSWEFTSSRSENDLAQLSFMCENEGDKFPV